MNRINPYDIIGATIGSYYVSEIFPEKINGHFNYKCICICGKERIVDRNNLISGRATSCGCSKSPKVIGKIFGYLEVIEYLKMYDGKHGYCRCKCHKCGNETIVRYNSLINGSTRSCGCLSKALLITHGMTNTKEFKIWTRIKTVCNNPNQIAYNNIGRKGITVCDRWLNSFENFYSDMGKCPDNHVFSRRDMSKEFSPENCFWELKKANIRRNRNLRWITYKDKNICMRDFADILHLKSGTVRNLLEKGASVIEIEKFASIVNSSDNRKLRYTVSSIGEFRTALALESHSIKNGRYNRELIKNNSIHYYTQYYFKDLKGPKNGYLFFDFALFKDGILQCLIEYHGEQHYKDTDFGRQQREITDPMKLEYCQKNNIKLHIIPYYEAYTEEEIQAKVREILVKENIITVSPVKDIIIRPAAVLSKPLSLATLKAS